jgi:hypothetical protein
MADPGPQILGPTGQPQRVDKAASEAAVIYNQARAYQDAEKAAVKFVDTMRKMGHSFEDIAKYGEKLPELEKKLLNVRSGEASEWKRFASELNLSWDQIKKMPLKDLGKNFGNIAESVFKLSNPIMSIGTAALLAIEGVKALVNSLGRMNQAAGGFALASGNIQGAIAPSVANRASTISAAARLTGMGFGGDERKSIQQGLMGQLAFTKNREAMEASRPMVAAGAIARVSAQDPAAVAERMGRALQSGISLSDYERAVMNITKDTKSFGTSVAVAAQRTDELTMANRAVGMTATGSAKAIKNFSAELDRGILTLSDIQNLDPARRQMSQTMATIQLAKITGQKIPGVTDQSDPMKALNNILRMKPEDSATMMKNILEKGIPKMGAITGGRGRELAGTLAIAQGGGFGAPTGMTTAMAHGINPAEMPKLNLEGAKGMEELADQATKVSGSFDDFNSMIRKTIGFLGEFNDVIALSTEQQNKKGSMVGAAVLNMLIPGTGSLVRPY